MTTTMHEFPGKPDAFQQEAPLFSADPVKEKLILAFRLCAMLKLDDLTYTHISARSQTANNTFYINSLGPLFEEMTPSLLVPVSIEATGKTPQSVSNAVGEGLSANVTGDFIHKAIYKARPDVTAILHLHTPEGVAVSALKEGLSFLSQFSYHFVDNLSYHGYGGLVIAGAEGERLVASLGTTKAMIMKNHGLLTVGATMEEAFFYMYYLNLACKVQVMAQGMGKVIELPAAEMRQEASMQMRDFEPTLGVRDWQALVRKYKRDHHHAGPQHNVMGV